MPADKRIELRNPSLQPKRIVIYRDRRDLSIEEAQQKLQELSDLYGVFNVVALLRDVSQSGLGVRFEGQQLMGKNILQPGEGYLLKIVFWLPGVPQELAELLVPEGDEHFLLVKGICRWSKPAETSSLAGFELTGSHAEKLLRHLG